MIIFIVPVRKFQKQINPLNSHTERNTGRNSETVTQRAVKNETINIIFPFCLSMPRDNSFVLFLDYLISASLNNVHATSAKARVQDVAQNKRGQIKRV